MKRNGRWKGFKAVRSGLDVFQRIRKLASRPDAGLQEHYPSVHFELHQGEYTSISNWIKEGSVDFGFVNPLAVHDIATSFLSEDELLAVLPFGHALSRQTTVTFQELSKEPFILLAEGDFNDPLYFFRQNHLEPNIQYLVHDDYTIMSMVEKKYGHRHSS